MKNITELRYAEILTELGRPEIERRIAELPAYHRYSNVASYYGGNGDSTMTPAQAAAWAKFAESLSTKDRPVLIDGRDIKVAKSTDELAETVGSLEHYERDRARRAAEAEAEAHGTMTAEV